MADDDDEWLARFHAGDRDTLAACYREHYAAVDRRIAGFLRGVDRENVVHEVFYRLVSDAEFRRGFQGGALGAWLAQVARRQALDVMRRRSREVLVEPQTAAELDDVARSTEPVASEDDAHAKDLVERFRRDVLPPAWERVFEACFLRQLSQREAAAALGMSRTTLAYQELRIRRLLKRYVLRGDGR